LGRAGISGALLRDDQFSKGGCAMSYPYAAYEFLVYVIPGGLILFTVMALFPTVRELFGRERVDAGGLGIFLVLAFAVGQFVDGVSHQTVERAMTAAGCSHQSDTVAGKGSQTIISSENRTEFARRVQANYGVAIDTLDLNKPDHKRNWINVIRRIHSLVSQKNDRLEVYVRQYAVNMNIATSLIAVLLILLGVLFIQHRRRAWLVGIRTVDLRGRLGGLFLVLAVLGVALALQRMFYFDRLFAQELFNAYVTL
jgi:hypothetical protein